MYMYMIIFIVHVHVHVMQLVHEIMGWIWHTCTLYMYCIHNVWIWCRQKDSLPSKLKLWKYIWGQGEHEWPFTDWLSCTCTCNYKWLFEFNKSYRLHVWYRCSIRKRENHLKIRRNIYQISWSMWNTCIYPKPMLKNNWNGSYRPSACCTCTCTCSSLRRRKSSRNKPESCRLCIHVHVHDYCTYMYM